MRVALGAQPLHVLTTVFKRPLVQIALGIGVGIIIVTTRRALRIQPTEALKDEG